jgi:hypothetical protein
MYKGRKMPESVVYFYQEKEGVAPVLEWLDGIKDKKAVKKCYAAISILKKIGHDLRRPHADYLRDEIYELRVSLRGVQYRLLYFFHGKNIIIIAHGLIKENKVPQYDIDLSIERKEKYKENPKKHTYLI